jgi:methylmalonyl-CoA/ethylmalonyl-CoA epimerase
MVPLSVFGANAAFHHVGLAVPSIVDVAGSAAEVVRDDLQQVSVAFVNLDGVCVELIEPATTTSPVSRSLQEGRQLVHLCFEVADLEEAVATGRAAGFHRIARPVPARAFDNRRIAWVYSRTYGLVELLERNGDARS